MTYDVPYIKGRIRLTEEIVARFNHAEQVCKSNSRACVIGLHGIGGLGKTSLCKMIINFYKEQYAGKCELLEFPFNNRCFTSINKTLLKQVDHFNKAVQLMSEQMKLHKVFVAIDNVSEHSLEEAKRILEVGFAPGSKVLITSRTEAVLKDLLKGCDKTCVGCVPRVGQREALETLKTSIGEDLSFASRDDSLDRILGLCFFNDSYHPLALNAMGRRLWRMEGWGDDKALHEELSRIIFTFGSQRPSIEEVITGNFESIPSTRLFIFLDVAVTFQSLYETYSLKETCDLLRILYEDESLSHDDIDERLGQLGFDGLVRFEGVHLGSDGGVRFEGDKVVVHDVYLELAKRKAASSSRFLLRGTTNMEMVEWAKLERVVLLGDISDDREEREVEELQDCPNVQVLIVEWLNFSKGLRLESMRSLRVLKIWGGNMGNVTGVRAAERLAVLELNQCKWTEEQLFRAEVETLNQLQTLVITVDSACCYQVPLDLTMVSRNRTLVTLKLEGFTVSDSQLVSFMTCVGSSSSLECMSLTNCGGFMPNRNVVAAILDALDATRLLQFYVDNTPVEGNAAIEAQLERNRQHSEFLHRQTEILSTSAHLFQKVQATAARLFICGDPYAGKTTLLTAVSRFNSRTSGCPAKSRLLVPCLLSEVQRTRGIEVRVLMKDGLQVSLWDMAGHEEFHAFHDHIFPDLNAVGSPTFFLFVWSPVNSKNEGDGACKPAYDFEKSFKYWLKFITSKSRLSNVTRRIIVVLTRKDQIDDVLAMINPSMLRVLEDFKDIIELADVFEVNARNPVSVESVTSCIFDTARAVLETVKIHEICSKVRRRLTIGAGSKRKEPILAWKDFERLCETECDITDLFVQKAIACSLNESGDLIYLNNMAFLILDTNWFCNDVMGDLILHFSLRDGRTMPITDGIVPERVLENFLKRKKGSRSVEGAHLVELMEALHLCCRIPDGKHPSFFIPTALRADQSPRCWRVATEDPNTSFSYMGRRLECRKRDLTFLTPGLFPLIQVNFLRELCNIIRAHVKLDKDFISISFQGTQVMVEFCKAMEEHVIDVLVRLSELDQTITYKFVEEKVIRTIVDLCAQPIGNQGVQLVEGIIRPDCLTEPSPRNTRENQCVLIEDLKKELARQVQASPGRSNFLYEWEDNPNFEPGGTSIYDLLGFEESSKIVKSYEATLRGVEEELGIRPERETERKLGPGQLRSTVFSRAHGDEAVQEIEEENMVTVCPETALTHSKLDKIYTKLDRMDIKLDRFDTKLDAIQRHVANIDSLQKKVLPHLQKKIEQLLFLETEKEGGRIPRLCFLTTEGVGGARKFVTTFVRGVESIRVELCCEHKEETHRVDGQEGICITTLEEGAAIKKALPYVNAVLKVVTLVAKVGVHVTTGLGGIIPDFSKIVAGYMLDTPGLLDIHGMPQLVGSVEEGMAAFVGWEEWLVHVLELHGGLTDSNIASKFQLRRAIYPKTSQVAWLCDTHLKYAQPLPLAK